MIKTFIFGDVSDRVLNKRLGGIMLMDFEELIKFSFLSFLIIIVAFAEDLDVTN